jgi:hypothetical protein
MTVGRSARNDSDSHINCRILFLRRTRSHRQWALCVKACVGLGRKSEFFFLAQKRPDAWWWPEKSLFTFFSIRTVLRLEVQNHEMALVALIRHLASRKVTCCRTMVSRAEDFAAGSTVCVSWNCASLAAQRPVRACVHFCKKQTSPARALVQGHSQRRRAVCVGRYTSLQVSSAVFFIN